jgi:VRR-NUC domain
VRYAKRRDTNHAEIVAALRKTGFEVIDFASAGHDIPDLLAIKPLRDGVAWAVWVEVKAKGGRLSDGQKRFQAIFQPRGEWYEARDAEEAVATLQAMYLKALRGDEGRSDSQPPPLAPKTPSRRQDDLGQLRDL